MMATCLRISLTGVSSCLIPPPHRLFFHRSRRDTEVGRDSQHFRLGRCGPSSGCSTGSQHRRLFARSNPSQACRYGAIHASIRCSTSRNLKVSALSIPMATRG
jgi:hypothetical protein